ncbi:MAG: tetratricopeptide repeat protein [Planctomycetes bacterium]|nr:tetratricopeptide repeat protein [Planctomycetota bacterium]
MSDDRTRRARYAGRMRPSVARLVVLPLLLLALSGAARAPGAVDEAKALRRAGRPAEAVPVLDAALARHPGDDELEGLLGLCLLEAGQQGRVLELAKRRAGYTGDDFRMHVFLGRVAELDGALPAAIQSYRAAIERNPNAVEAYNQLVGAYLKNEAFGKALKQAEKLEQISPELGARLAAAALAAQGEQYRRAGAETLTLAAERFLAAHRKQPDDLTLTEMTLDTCVLAAYVDEALAVVEEVYGKQRDATYWTWIGTCRAAGMDGDGARAAFEQALALEPTNDKAALGLARLLVDDGDLDAAREVLSKVTVKADSGRVALLMGEVQVALGDVAEGVDWLRKATELDPGQPKAHYQLGRALMQLGRRDEANAVLEHFRELQERSLPRFDDDGGDDEDDG